MATGEVGRRSADVVSHAVEADMNDHVYAITLHLHMEGSIVCCLDKLTGGEKKKVKSDLATWMFALVRLFKICIQTSLASEHVYYNQLEILTTF